MSSKSKTHQKRIRDNIKHFKNASIDYHQLIKDFYIENGLAYISCNVHSILDILNPYAVRGYEILKRDFADFIDENGYHIPVEYPIVLEICGGNFTQGQQKTIERVVSDYYALRLADTEFDLVQNKKKARFLLVMGIISFLIMLLLNSFRLLSGTFMEPFIVLLWFFLWDFFEIVWFERRERIMDKAEAAQMASMKVIFREKFKDIPYDEETSRKIIDEILENGLSDDSAHEDE
ncbi:MAG TPA: hypothetical protein PLN48_15830 [Lachnospiraceae bacterium]|nr:hypothetical protein [Lachnospiraceae bacterium]